MARGQVPSKFQDDRKNALLNPLQLGKALRARSLKNLKFNRRSLSAKG